MKPWTALLLLCLSLCSAGARADQANLPRPLTASSATGEILFKIDPGPRGWAWAEEAFGSAYRVDAKGRLTELWKTKGWYCEKLFVADDGRFVVGIGTWQTRMTSGFLNTKTNELIHEDRVNYFTVPVLFDGRGTVISRAAPPKR